MIYLNSHELKFTKFPNGETCVDGNAIKNIVDGYDNVKIKLKYQDDADLMKLLFVKKFLDELHIETSLVITYMPYSRMDRVEGDSVFTLKYVANFINSLNFESVSIYEPHSDVTPALLNNCKVYHITNMILSKVMTEIEFDSNKDYIYYPDASAEKHFGKTLTYKSLTGLKQRDFVTGRIKKLNIAGELPKDRGFKVIMVDDLCSRGGTFILGAKQLIKMGASDIYLITTHCEDSIYEGDILKTDLITKVFTTDSMLTNAKNDKIKIISLIK